MIRRRRLGIEHIDARTCDGACGQRRMQRPFIDNPAARGVDEIGGLFHALQPRRAEHSDRFRGAWAVDGHEIRPRERGIEIGDRLASGRPHGFGR